MGKIMMSATNLSARSSGNITRVVLHTQLFVKRTGSVECHTLIGGVCALLVCASVHEATHLPILAGWDFVDH